MRFSCHRHDISTLYSIIDIQSVYLATWDAHWVHILQKWYLPQMNSSHIIQYIKCPNIRSDWHLVSLSGNMRRALSSHAKKLYLPQINSSHIIQYHQMPWLSERLTFSRFVWQHEILMPQTCYFQSTNSLVGLTFSRFVWQHEILMPQTWYFKHYKVLLNAPTFSRNDIQSVCLETWDTHEY